MERTAMYNRSTGDIGTSLQQRDIPFFVRRVLIFYLLFLPFQTLPNYFGIENTVFANLAAYIDEITTVVMFCFLFTFIVLRPSAYKIYNNATPTTLILLFVFSGLISMVWNQVDVIHGIFGIYNVLKNIIIIYFFMSLRWERNDIFILAKGMVVITLILAIFGIAGEILQLLGRDSHNLVMTQEYTKRVGINRVHSLLGYGNTNYLGMYAVLAFFLSEFATRRPLALKVMKFVILVLIILTLSNRAWLGLLLVLILTKKQFRSGYVFFALLASTASIFILFMVLESYSVIYPEQYYRAFTYLRSLELFMANPLIGVGPGMYGDVMSVIFGSPYYADWPTYFEDLFMQTGGIDSFWTVVLVQFGLMGFAIFGMIFAMLYKKIQSAAARIGKADHNLYRIGQVLKSFIIALIMLGLGSGLNKPFVVYSYFALYGIFMSICLRYGSDAHESQLSWK